MMDVLNCLNENNDHVITTISRQYEQSEWIVFILEYCEKE